MTVDPILARLTALHPVAIDMSLDRVRRLLGDLGDPHDALAPVIHVAGTNGKGSTVAYLRAFLEAAGARVHVYTSPHLVRFNERIRVAGRIITDTALSAILEEVERINAGRPITFFEVTTAAAFLAFARVPADAVLLEVGMGGRLDATNVVRAPAACALTPISLDHMTYLGDSVGLIAAEKAGILKQGVPAAVAPQPAAALAAFAARAAELGVTLYRAGHEWRVSETAGGFRYEGRRSFDLPAPALPGRHQFDNAGLAIAASELVPGFGIGLAQIRAGLAQVEWPARLQHLSGGALAARLPRDRELYLDGGHNEGAGAVLADWAARLPGGCPLDLVWGMLSTKDPVKVLALLAPHVRALRAVPVPDDRLSLSADAVAESARRAGIADAAPAADVPAALAELGRLPGPARVLIAGSLHLAGAVLRTDAGG